MCKEKQPVPCFRPPPLNILTAMKGWAALVLAVSTHLKISHIDLLRHKGRSGPNLTKARRLLVWAFMEVSDAPYRDSMAWLEQCVALGQKSLKNNLQGVPPADLAEVVATYSRLLHTLGAADVHDAIAAGLFGRRMPRARVWPKGFLARLELQDTP